jgi:uncharacterized protein YegP (UPF0339 family)
MVTRRFGITFAVLALSAFFGAANSNESYAVQDKKDDAAGALKFEVYEDMAKEFRWRLKAANGKVLATPGQGYKAKSDCKKAVERIRSEVAGDKLKFETYEDTKKETRWRLKSGNGQVIASSSEGYKTKADCEKAIEEIKKGAAKAAVEEK